MASSSTPRIRSYVASGAIPAYCAVKLDTSSPSKNPTVVVCTSGRALGISQNSADAVSGDTIEVALPGGGGLAKISGSVTMGNSLKATTGGKLAATSGAGDKVAASAVESGADGDVIGVEVVFGDHYAADAT